MSEGKSLERTTEAFIQELELSDENALPRTRQALLGGRMPGLELSGEGIGIEFRASSNASNSPEPDDGTASAKSLDCNFGSPSGSRASSIAGATAAAGEFTWKEARDLVLVLV